CAGLQPYLVESLLFGHGGVLTAGFGTLYLKDPAALPRDAQQRLADLFTGNEPNAPRLICGAVRPSRAEVDAAKLVPVFHPALAAARSARHPGSATAAEAAEQRRGRNTVKHPCLVILDADDWLAKQLRELAGESRWLVRTARSVDTALSLVRESSPAVLLVQ